MLYMHTLKKIFKTLFSKTFVILFASVCFLGIFFYWGWFEKQYYKALGVYYVYQGDRAYQHADLQLAIDDYTQGLNFYPEHYGAWFNLGNIYVVYEDYSAAAEAYEKSIKYNDKFTVARMNLGIISAEKLGDFDTAIKQYKTIVNSKRHLFSIPFIFNNKKSEKANKGLAYYNMGVAYRKKSLYQNGNIMLSHQYLEDAIEAYNNASKILKNDYDSYYNLALAYHLADDYQDAGLNYCKAIELQPMNYEAHYNLAILLRHLKMYKEAYNELEKATVLSAGNSKNSNTTSYVFDILNDVSGALIANNQYNYLVDKMDDEPSNSEVTYVNGKIVATDALDRAMLKNFQTCETKDFFRQY